MPRTAAKPSLADMNAAPGGVAAVDRAVNLLAVFSSRDEPLRLAELSERSGLYKSTVLRLLASLEHAGLVQRLDDGRYVLGHEIARLYRAYSSTLSLDHLVIPVLQELVNTTGESAAYHIVQGQGRICRYRVDSPQPVRDHIKPGEVLPLERGTGGRVLVAFDPALKDKEEKGKQRLYAEIREKGYFSSQGDRLAEVSGISAPVFDAGKQIVAAVTLTMPAHRYTEDHIQPTVHAAQEITKRLGGPRGTPPSSR